MTPDQFPSTILDDRTAGEVVEQARRDGVSGRVWMRLTDLERPVLVYLRDGEVYAAERSTDPGFGIRLLVEGIVTRRQLRAGTLDAAGVDRLGSLFDLDPTVDRVAVEAFLARTTAELLTTITTCPVAAHAIDLAHGHPNEIDQWFGIPTPVTVPDEFTAPAAAAVPTGHIVLDDLAAALITDSVLAAIDRALTSQRHHTAALIDA